MKPKQFWSVCSFEWLKCHQGFYPAEPWNYLQIGCLKWHHSVTRSFDIVTIRLEIWQLCEFARYWASLSAKRNFHQKTTKFSRETGDVMDFNLIQDRNVKCAVLQWQIKGAQSFCMSDIFEVINVPYKNFNLRWCKVNLLINTVCDSFLDCLLGSSYPTVSVFRTKAADKISDLLTFKFTIVWFCRRSRICLIVFLKQRMQSFHWSATNWKRPGTIPAKPSWFPSQRSSTKPKSFVICYSLNSRSQGWVLVRTEFMTTKSSIQVSNSVYFQKPLGFNWKQ